MFSKTREEHITHVKQVLDKLQQNQLWAKAEKCTFFKRLTSWATSYRKEKEIKKVDAVLSWPTVYDIQVFLGFANFYRRFIRAYSKVTTPLTKLLRKEIKSEWGRSEDEAFSTLKEAFTSAPPALPTRQINCD